MANQEQSGIHNRLADHDDESGRTFGQVDPGENMRDRQPGRTTDREGKALGQQDDCHGINHRQPLPQLASCPPQPQSPPQDNNNSNPNNSTNKPPRNPLQAALPTNNEYHPAP